MKLNIYSKRLELYSQRNKIPRILVPISLSNIMYHQFTMKLAAQKVNN